jgi:hypothetical protein
VAGRLGFRVGHSHHMGPLGCTSPADDLSCAGPSLNFPVEIWCLVFCYGIQMTRSRSDILTPRHSMRHNPAPLPFVLVVSHVCRYWRDISVNSPTLWTQVDYGTDVTYGRELGNSNLVELFIKRSQNQLLDIRISSPSYPGSDVKLYRRNYQDALDIVFAHSHRSF